MRIIYEASPSKEHEKIIADGIDANDVILGKKPVDRFGFFIKNNFDKVVGGLTGYYLFGCLHVDMLWVEASLRGQGWGTKLMQEAEALALKRSCNFLTVFTMSWEALPFYQKLHYFVEFTRHGYQDNTCMYLLRKNL